MFAWIANKKEDGQLPLSAASRECLEKIAQRLKELAPGDSLRPPEEVLEMLLTGQLSLVSTLASQELVLDESGISLGQPQDKASPAQQELAIHGENGQTAPTEASPAQLETAVEPASPPHSESPATTDAPADTETELNTLRQQVQHLQDRLNQRRDQQAAQHAKLSSLLKKTHQQETEIANLKSQVDQLRVAASIGESQLNRWRFNNFRNS
jgi:septal ring factor EnvC (AmiA/AmiB activator)